MRPPPPRPPPGYGRPPAATPRTIFARTTSRASPVRLRASRSSSRRSSAVNARNLTSVAIRHLRHGRCEPYADLADAPVRPPWLSRPRALDGFAPTLRRKAARQTEHLHHRAGREDLKHRSGRRFDLRGCFLHFHAGDLLDLPTQ